VNTVRVQQTLLWTDIVTSNEERKDLSQLIVPGFRAVTVRVSRNGSGIGLVRPGDYVDVVVVLGPMSAPESKSSIVLLQKILVLAAGNDTSQNRDEKKPNLSDEESITLSITLEEAQLLSLAEDKGKLTIAVRPPSDSQINNAVADRSFDSILKAVTRPQFRTPTTPTNTGPVDIGPRQQQ
jgi:pilus assembly protein CpaB